MTSRSTLGVERGVGTNLPMVTDNLDALGEKVSAKSLTEAYITTCGIPGTLKFMYHPM